MRTTVQHSKQCNLDVPEHRQSNSDPLFFFFFFFFKDPIAFLRREGRAGVAAVHKAARGVRRAVGGVERAARGVVRRVSTAQAARAGLRERPKDGSAEAAALQSRVQREVRLLDKQDTAVVRSLLTRGESLLDLYTGAHTVIDDKGRLYDQWKAMQAKARISSHYRGVNTQQYELDINGRPLLFGKTASGDTWAQMEAASATIAKPNVGRILTGKQPLVDPVLVQHMRDYLIYKGTGLNVGPLGLNRHNDKNPIMLQDVASS
jgi:hypothetical protein